MILFALQDGTSVSALSYNAVTEKMHRALPAGVIAVQLYIHHLNRTQVI